MSDEAKIEAIKEKFRQAIPHFRAAMEDAKKAAGPGGKVGLGIIAVGPKGGQITAQFHGDEFFEDIATLCGIGPTTEEQKIEVKAKKFVDQLAASGVRMHGDEDHCCEHHD